MKQCPICGHPSPDDSEFCGNCGNRIDGQKDIFDVYDSIKGTVGALFGNRAKSSWNEGTYSVAQGGSDNFISPDETVQAVIGVSYIESLMSGAGFKNGAAILTNKRLYYFGRSFSTIGKGINTATEEGVISVDEITSTRFVHGSPLSYLIAAVAFLLPGIMLFGRSFGSAEEFAGIAGTIGLIFVLFGVLSLITYFAGRSTVLEIAFPGRKYWFDSRWHSASSMREFQRQIHLVKDNSKADQNAPKGEETEILQ